MRRIVRGAALSVARLTIISPARVTVHYKVPPEIARRARNHTRPGGVGEETMSFVVMRDDVRHLLARLHATLDRGGDAAALARAHEPLLRRARALLGGGRLGAGEREELTALVDGVALLRALGSRSVVARAAA
jgi:hypothetical protein